jgi:FkbM family methyltransferase
MWVRKAIIKPIKKSIRNLGLDVRRRRPSIGTFLESRRIEVFLDVGANVGQTGLELRDKGYRGRIVSFEPVRSVFETLKRVADRDGNWEAHNFALGSASGRAIIKVSENTVFNSMLDQTPEARRFNESTRVLREEIVEVRKLDDFFSQFKVQRAFLKIVTQGFERQVLDGARDSLKEILGVELILPIVQLYDGNWSFPEALNYMSERGFVIGQTGQESYESQEKVTLLELYCIFRRQSDPVAV